MALTEIDIQPLVAGDKLTRDEFIRRWEAMPNLKRAELIGGTVFIPSPVNIGHGIDVCTISMWLGNYEAETLGCQAGAGSTWYMLDDAPQPDIYLRLFPQYGGQAWESSEDKFLHGAPELAVEVCHSTSAYDLHQKKELYREAGVREYLAIPKYEKEVCWFELVEGEFKPMKPGADGILRSKFFPGLWLNVDALVRNDRAGINEALRQGLASPEHEELVIVSATQKEISPTRY